jgi:hypothetical protein
MTSVSDLSVVDIEFLQAARDINKNPENYEKTGNSAHPANTASIKRVTDLTDEQVSYRMGGNSNSKGFEKGDKNLIISHDPQVQGSTLGPRSIELTPHGSNILDKAEKRMSRFAGVSKKEFEKLERKVQKNRERKELMNIINNKFKSTNHQCKIQYELKGDWEMLLAFTETTIMRRVIIHKNYHTKNIFIEIKEDQKDDDDERIAGREIKFTSNKLFGRKLHRICKDIKEMRANIQQPEQ